MTARARGWLRTFADEAVLSDLFAAVDELMGQVCDHDPSECSCPLNQMTPREVAEWVQLEVTQDRQRPMRFEPGYRPRRLKDDPPPQWNLAASG